jgi:hypothetical protein
MRSQTLMVRSASRRQVYVACVNLATMRVSNHEATGGDAPACSRNGVNIFLRHALNLIAPCRDPPGAFWISKRGTTIAMKIALLALLGLLLGALGGAALGIGAGLAWVEIFKTTSFEGYSGMLVFFTFMPLGAMIGGLGCALLFALLAFRDSEIAIEREHARRQDR